MQGIGKKVPDWAVVIAISKEHGMTPWEFWATCPPLWWQRLLTYRQCEQMAKDKEFGDFDDDDEEEE